MKYFIEFKSKGFRTQTLNNIQLKAHKSIFEFKFSPFLSN